MTNQIHEYLLESIKQINKLTDILLSVDMGADDLHAILDLKSQAIADLIKATNKFGEIVGDETGKNIRK